METVRLKVPGITCDGWVITIRMAVRRVTGVQKVEGNVKEQTIAIQFDPGEGSLKDIQEAMARVGYEAEEAGPTSGPRGGLA